MLSDDLILAVTLADHAGAVILPHFRSLPGIDDKGSGMGGFDPVTVADRGAEEVIRAHLSEAAPLDGVLGEEFPPQPSQNGRTWIVDPIDGTGAFIMGLPTWGTLVALHDGRRVSVGIMAQPFVGDRFFADDSGAYHLGRDEPPSAAKPIQTRTCPALSEATITTTSTDLFEPAELAGFRRVAAAARMVRYGYDCYGYSMVAAGHCDAVIERGLNSYDIAPFLPIIRAAGGIVTDFAGELIEPTLLDGYNGEALAVGDPALVPQIVEKLRG